MSVLSEMQKKSPPYVLCIVTESEGAAPGKPGFKMVVFADGSTLGTVGGGDLERQATLSALEMLRGGDTTRCEKFRLDQAQNIAGEEAPSKPTSMICGGWATLYFEHFVRQQRALLFGGGHIAQDLAPMLGKLGFAVEIFDNREDYATADRYPAQAVVKTGRYEQLVEQAEIDGQTYCFIFTHGHSHDYAVLHGLLARQPQEFAGRYIGMIGSRKKVGLLLGRLRSELPGVNLEKLYTPIGLEIGGDSPFEISLAICAEIQALAHGKPAHHMRLSGE